MVGFVHALSAAFLAAANQAGSLFASTATETSTVPAFAKRPLG